MKALAQQRFFVLTLVALFLFGCSSNSKKEDVTSAQLLELSDEEALTLGRIVLDELFAKYKPVDDKASLEYLNRVGQYVGHHAELRSDKVSCSEKRPKLNPANGFRFALVKTEEPFSLALPGGYIVLSKGMVDIVKSEDQLAGLLAFEIHHMLCHSGPSSFFYSAAESRVGNPLPFVQSQMDNLLAAAQVSAKQISSADRGAIITMTRAGYYAPHFPLLLKDLSKASNKQPFYTEKRVNTVKKVISKIKVAAKTVDARRARFETFRAAVKKI